MANPTTNYGFVLPTPTDLVTDLPADFDVALQGVDTRLKALQPGTTAGDLMYASSTANTNVRLGIGTTNQVLSVVGGVPAWATTADQTPLTTKGDIFTFSTVDARLAVGTNGQVLTADSSEATGLKYATPESGKVKQVIYGSTSTETSNSTTTFADTTLTATITPTSASNYILAFVNQNGLVKTAADSQSGINLKLMRGGSDIAGIAMNTLYTGVADTNVGCASICFKDSPASTSALTYKTQFKNQNVAFQVYVQASSALSTIILMEVAP